MIEIGASVIGLWLTAELFAAIGQRVICGFRAILADEEAIEAELHSDYSPPAAPETPARLRKGSHQSTTLMGSRDEGRL